VAGVHCSSGPVRVGGQAWEGKLALDCPAFVSPTPVSAALPHPPPAEHPENARDVDRFGDGAPLGRRRRAYRPEQHRCCLAPVRLTIAAGFLINTQGADHRNPCHLRCARSSSPDCGDCCGLGVKVAPYCALSRAGCVGGLEEVAGMAMVEAGCRSWGWLGCGRSVASWTDEEARRGSLSAVCFRVDPSVAPAGTTGVLKGCSVRLAQQERQAW